MTCFGLAHPRKLKMLTDPVFFDADCLSSFLTTHEEDVLVELYGHRICVPAVVYRELSPPWRPDLRDDIGGFLTSGKATLQDIDVGSEAHDLFRHLTNPSSPGVMALGKGEAACLGEQGHGSQQQPARCHVPRAKVPSPIGNNRHHHPRSNWTTDHHPCSGSHRVGADD